MRFRVLPGFRDFPPEALATRRHLEAAWHRASRSAGFQEVDGPVLEPLELFTAKSGEEIVGQLYAFEDRGGRSVALRPEMTPTLARMIAARAGGLPKPIKWYSVPEFYRYEKPQKGRTRAFHQWNADIVGSAEPAADAEAIAVAVEALRELGLRPADVVVRLNDRRLVHERLASLELDADAQAFALACIDKLERDRDAPARLEARVGATRAAQVLAWCEALPLDAAPELAAVVEACGDYGIAEFVEPDFRIVRGLAYYTGPVWEIFDRGASLRSVAGGGRYDALIAQLGGPDLPALGFGMGDVVLGELLRERGLLPDAPARVDTVVLPVTAELAGAARQVAARLRAAGERAETPYGVVKLGRALKAADAAGARRVVLIGPDEWADGSVRVKDLASGHEQLVPLDKLV